MLFTLKNFVYVSYFLKIKKEHNFLTINQFRAKKPNSKLLTKMICDDLYAFTEIHFFKTKYFHKEIV